jgi:hypothetical protein
MSAMGVRSARSLGCRASVVLRECGCDALGGVKDLAHFSEHEITLDGREADSHSAIARVRGCAFVEENDRSDGSDASENDCLYGYLSPLPQ